MFIQEFSPCFSHPPFAPPASLRALYDRSFERFVNDAFSGAAPLAQRRTGRQEPGPSPSTCPASSREDLTIGIEGAVVRIESKAEAKRQFKAAYELPQDIDVAASEAKLENGVLTLKLGKLVPVSKCRAARRSTDRRCFRPEAKR